MNQTGIMRDSSTLSKIPYGGFSPVRLQTGSPRRSSGGTTALIRRASVALRPYGHYGQVGGSSVTTLPVQRPLTPQRVMLSRRITAYYGLIRTTPVVGAQRRRVGPHFYLHVFPIVPSPGPRRIDQVLVAVPSLTVLAFTIFALVRHPRILPPTVLAGCITRLASSLSLRPDRLLARHRHGLLRSSFRSAGHPDRTSNIDYAATANYRGRTFTCYTCSLVGCTQRYREPTLAAASRAQLSQLRGGVESCALMRPLAWRSLRLCGEFLLVAAMPCCVLLRFFVFNTQPKLLTQRNRHADQIRAARVQPGFLPLHRSAWDSGGRSLSRKRQREGPLFPWSQAWYFKLRSIGVRE
jgi:hypothetical protein